MEITWYAKVLQSYLCLPIFQICSFYVLVNILKKPVENILQWWKVYQLCKWSFTSLNEYFNVLYKSSFSAMMSLHTLELKRCDN